MNTNMKVICLDDFTSLPALFEREVPIPQPGPGQLLISVHAAGVTPTELQWYPTTHTTDGEARRYAVPGHEFSGIIVAQDDHLHEFQVGQEVYGLNDWFAEGATAQFCLTNPSSIAPKPASLSHAEAASVPIAALTAWQGLIEHAKLQAGQTVLIHGGSGAVGIFAVQLAHHLGANVITTASNKHSDFLLQLGAQQVIDYRSERFEELVHDVDVVFDGVGGDTLQRSWSVLKSGGHLVTIAADSEGTQDERTKAAFFIVEPKQDQLKEVTTLLDQGILKPYVDVVVPLDKASEAYTNQIERPTGRGKVVVSIIE